ncbi:hypothetical protein [Moritella sp.]|uniref:hypothetical protein n=1 Tax=Moritella sp. TaxID=78556 RepID=UPI0025DCBC9E|nr:hypothetical protein [Moritella sp.]
MPKIGFFEERNPQWREGKELPCIGEINASMFTFFVHKSLRKVLQKNNINWDLGLINLTRRLVK